MINKRKLYPLTLSAILLASASSASAQYVEQGFYIAPSIGYYVYDSDNDNQTDDAPLYGLNVGLQLSKYFALEAGYFRIESEVTPKDSRRYKLTTNIPPYELNPTGEFTNEKQGGSTFYKEGDDVSVDAYHVDAVFNIPMPGGISPYLAIGYTKLDGDPQLTEGKDDMMTAALGAKYYLTPNLFLQGDVRALHSWDNEDTDYSAGLGVGYLFGTPPAAPVEKVIEEPTPTPIPEEPDSDGDGIPDSRDKCPNTPPGETVDADGCPVGLPGGQKEVSITLKVLFDVDKSVIKPEYFSEIESVAKFMRDYPNTTAEIEGHTSSPATNAYNLRLSQRRADAVRDALVTQFGIDANRLQAIGYGEERPIADNNTKAGREQNRRVVATLRAIVQTPATP